MKPEEHSEQIVEVAGWQVRLTTYRLGSEWHTKADNVSPGAALTRTTGTTKAEAEEKALARARELLGRTKRHTV